ncbi:chemotaxis protein CheB [Nodosilinea sp. LEGE 07298]|uniref:chemotaxis protein CheB n=1 Tax=Nodosilinea sp. LEGE 07298 TaxID=2777970 RepID=UPI0018825EB7|nr:chemotaxis protein CheB [Nodosilinea sp. LEGE 07298]MBE9110799.1 chemotaxis protein CheB [Nodosilinea sp. LEGE 07298]
MTDLSSSVALFPALQFDLVTIVASAGGIKALAELLPLLPADFAAALIIVMHLDPNTASLLPQILDRMTALAVKDAEAGEAIKAQTIYTAPPDYHLLVKSDRTLHLTQTKKVNFTRPSADCTLTSVAECFGNRAIAVVLTGYGHDGALGIRAIKQHGGRVIAQDPATAAVASMPQTAIDTGAVDWILPIDQIPLTLVKLVQQNGE